MRCLRLVTTTFATLAVLAGVVPAAGFVGQARAGIPGVAQSAVAVYRLKINGETVGYRACATGSVDDTPFVLGAWTFTLTGAQSDGSIRAPIPVVQVGAAFNLCLPDVLKFDAEYGAYSASLTYSGAGLDSVTYATGGFLWGPSPMGDQTYGTGL